MVTKYKTSTIVIYNGLEIFFKIIIFFKSLFFVQKKTETRSMLLIEPYQLGDVISLSVMIGPLKSKFPDCKIYILTKLSNQHVYEEDNRIDEVLVADFPWTDHGKQQYGKISRWKKMLRQLSEMRRLNDFDIGFDTRGDIRSQFVLKLLGVKKVIGYTRNSGSNLTNLGLLVDIPVEQNVFYPHRYEANAYLLKEIGISLNEIFPLKFPSYITHPEVSIPVKKYILIHIGGGWIYKRWRTKNWVNLIESLLEKFDYDIHLIGGIAEQEHVFEVYNLLPQNIRVKPVITSFKELVSEIKLAYIYIGLDSGPLHIADTLNKVVLGLYGAGNSLVWKPYSNGSSYLHKIENFSCNPCNQRKCFYPDNNCMDAITVQDVLMSFEKIDKNLRS